MRRILLFASVAFAASCTTGAEDPVSEFSVDKSGAHCATPDAPGTECRRATFARSQDELIEALAEWGYGPDAVEFDGSVVLLFGVNESSNCPAVVDSIEVENGVVEVMLLPNQEDCNADSLPRSFVVGGLPDEAERVLLSGSEVELLRF